MSLDKIIDPSDWPRCDRCQLPVQDFRVTDTGDTLILVAACHGETQEVKIPDELWDGVIYPDFRLGPAFVEKL